MRRYKEGELVLREAVHEWDQLRKELGDKQHKMAFR